MQFCSHILVLGLVWGAVESGAVPLTETFDGWTDDLSYGGTATYNHAGVGIWVSHNALARIENARSGHAVRLHDEDPTPWLEFRGLDGHGIDGGVGTVSFYYRHWDGNAGDVAFQLQYRIGTGTWTDAGPETLVPNDTRYRLFSRTLGLTEDDVILRVLSTAHGERLLIDDFAVSDGAGVDPVLSFLETAMSAGEADGTIQATLQISPPAVATVEVSVVAGDATPGVDFTWSPTTLVFSAEAFEQDITVHVTDDGAPEISETATWEISSAPGAEVNPAAGRFTLTILDDDQVQNTNDVVFTIMAANTTSGNSQSYEAPGIRIFQALQPDVVAIQEFNTDHIGGRRGFVDATFGADYHYRVESGSDSIPNGIISRWPIMAFGEWADPQVNDRDFAWATLDIPGDKDLHVISVHLHGSGGAGSRSIEAGIIVSRVQNAFPADDYIVIAGDFNTGSRSEGCVQILKDVFVDTHVPVDQLGDGDTNANRNDPYDWVMVNPALDARHEPLSVGGLVFEHGIVFDTRRWGSPPAPALPGDSGVANMQHMAVMKAFSIPGDPPAPAIAARGTPHSWLIAFGWTNDFDQAELTDGDGDGMAAWEEYVAGTAPNDESSRFTVSGVFGGASVAAACETRPGRTYFIEWADDSDLIQWQAFANSNLGIYHQPDGSPGATHTFVDDFGPHTTGSIPAIGRRVYRVRVTLGP